MHAWSAPRVPTLDGTPPALRIHDSARRGPAVPAAEGPVGLYVCGITPYDATHMGHAATYVAFDLLHRQWLDAGREVTYVQNVTDIDDPLLERARATGVDWRALATEQTDLFRADMAALNVLPPTFYVGAVESIEWIVPIVEDLLARNLAYRVPGRPGAPGEAAEPDGDVYFDAAAAASAAWTLGDVSGYGREAMLEFFAERGGDPERPGKRDALDPLLWRVARDGEPNWEGDSLGPGRPGWHIECSVIARRFLPAPFTVQGGGSDLVFPHHEFSAGHAAACDGHRLAEHFMHTGMVGLDGEKMSKSRGNLVLVSRLRHAGEDPMAVRTVLLGQHYRTDWFWTAELLDQARRRLASWRARLATATLSEGAGLVASLRERLADDLDAPGALAALDDWAAGAPDRDGDAPGSGAQLVTAAADALLGLRLA
ncbi:L-cysteine:1D-myo-inositol 2-amino-2-deoxy-alpha-D-glucopyranoside ligase [Zafaria cholistanensis]|uniref:L-cysteine:1D-myo-inositol 2-amino-2-deoxy-alpha-D-glucopyranoside ligase n=1 Tax=Zafaria cholistanensis TaxID=1682741 RepID=A0A5A7NPJ3_9MICC|nr:cysteine--1-D-myo-inosityl 2-amino-2-deoxy-alpha-D-glucopyranoside ligase [Zafaria cholistanensis]GER22082.1 L-cysteine:1D-myo-inositol 2-amino-2-deoxy-alpha-D-glucopyranoside ligase [Zafaria cholistanensis]